jgi:hypothetical protein
MATEKLKALVNTVIKQSTVDSSQITDPTQKFSLTAGDELEINDSKLAANNHWELELTSSVNGVRKWFALCSRSWLKLMSISVLTSNFHI